MTKSIDPQAETESLIAVKYAARPFGLMPREERVSWAIALMMKIHAITGWVMPGEPFDDVLLDQFQKKLAESYSNVNPEEVEFAFRNNPSVRDWGKSMNLALVDDVLSGYLEKRRRASIEEEHQKIKKEKPTVIPVLEEDLWEEFQRGIKSGKMTVDFLPDVLFTWKTKTYTPTKEDKFFCQQSAIQHRTFQLTENLADAKKLKIFLQQKEQGFFEGEFVEQIRLLSRKFLIYKLMKDEEHSTDANK